MGICDLTGNADMGLPLRKRGQICGTDYDYFHGNGYGGIVVT
jgi:hypothetical protein